MKSRVLLVMLLSAGACYVFEPTSLDGLQDARIRALCHFAYACCTAPERFASNQFQLDFKDEGTCVDEEGKVENRNNTVVARAKAVVAEGKGKFDDKRAQECEQPLFDAENNCKADVVLGGKPIADGLCNADAERGYVTGTVDDGGACNDDIECASYGKCDRTGDDPNTVTTKGKCKAARTKGQVCVDPNTGDFFDCVPGTSCQADANGKETCEDIKLEDDGAACATGADCKSGFCTAKESKICSDFFTPCTSDADCAFDGTQCDQTETAHVCSKTGPDVQVCGGGH